MISRPLSGVSAPVAELLTRIIASTDTYHRVHLRRIARTIDTIVESAPAGRLLELGTGAVIPLLLSELRPDIEVHVTEFDLGQPPTGEKTLSMGDLTVTCPVYRVNLEEQPLPVADQTFDTVICCEVIEHMEVDPMFMLSEVNRATRESGTLILTTPNITSTRAIYKILRGQDPYFYMQYRKVPSLYRHNYEYSVTSLLNVLNSAGFSGKVWTEDTFEDPVWTDVDKLRQLGYELSQVGDNIFAVASKQGPVKNRYPRLIYAD